MAVHELKVWPEYFAALLDGRKTFEVRKNDRGFQVGDTLQLREYAPGPDEYTGRYISRDVSYMINGDDVMGFAFGLQMGFVIMGLKDQETLGCGMPTWKELNDRMDRNDWKWFYSCYALVLGFLFCLWYFGSN